jgi:hypothetical protein
MTAKPKIYAFVNGRWGGGDVLALAVAEDGSVLAQHISSSSTWAQHDMGVTSDRNHDKYAEHYPGGFEVEWIDNPKDHPGVTAAFELNQKQGVAGAS